MTQRENTFQSQLIRDLKTLFPNCIVLKNDANYIQGFPDLLVLYGEHWAALECKRSMSAPRRPNQTWYVEVLNDMSYAAFICPENREDILDELQRAFGTCGTPRIFES